MVNIICFAVLWRAGGAGLQPFGKNWRKILAPVALYLVTGQIVPSLLLFVGTSLPITLIGDDLNKHGLLWWWVPLLCLIHSLPLLILGHWLALFLALIQWGLIISSNKFDVPKWEWYELSYGAFYGALL